MLEVIVSRVTSSREIWSMIILARTIILGSQQASKPSEDLNITNQVGPVTTISLAARDCTAGQLDHVWRFPTAGLGNWVGPLVIYTLLIVDEFCAASDESGTLAPLPLIVFSNVAGVAVKPPQLRTSDRRPTSGGQGGTTHSTHFLVMHKPTWML